jgi:hypothetical protein
VHPGYVATCGTGCLRIADDDEEEGVAGGTVAKQGTTLASTVKAGLTVATVRQFWTLGLPGGCMMAADASSFDVTTAFAGALGAAPPC